VGEHAGDNLDTGSDIVVELTAVGGLFWKKSGFNITSRRRRLAAAAAPPAPVAGSVNPIFYNINIGDCRCRCSNGLRCRRFLMFDVYIGRTLDKYRGGGREYGVRSRPTATL